VGRLSEADSARLIYRDPEFLSRFLDKRGRIRPRRSTGLTRAEQSRMARQVALARELALLPYPARERPVEIKGVTDAAGRPVRPGGTAQRRRR
jgi:small subunit ribosomal protein S18